MSDGADPRIDLGVTAFVVAVAAAVLWETRSIPPGVFEPLGSAPVPQATASLLILLCLVVIARAALRLGGRSAPLSEVADDARPRRFDALAVLLLTLFYVGALHLRLTTFAIMTTVYLILAVGLLLRFRLAAMPVVLLVAAATGFGCQYVFTRIFIVDLPGL
jgi:hypothetical protein